VSASSDRRKLDQAARALRRVADWINDLDTVSVDGAAHDSLGEVIYAVDTALEEAGGDA
jgi:hypothetical protein